MAFVIAIGNECYLLPLAENMGWNSAKKKGETLKWYYLSELFDPDYPITK